MYLASLSPPGVLYPPGVQYLPEVLAPQGLLCHRFLLDSLEDPFHLLCQGHLYNGSTSISLVNYNHSSTGNLIKHFNERYLIKHIRYWYVC